MSRRWLFAVSVSAHLAVAGAVFVSGTWRLERLHADPLHNDLVLQAQTQPEPRGGPVTRTPEFEHKKRKDIPKVVVQPEPPVDPTLIRARSDQPPGIGTGSGTTDIPGTCTENCPPVTDVAPVPVCGDGSVDASEACDDGNTASGDGCSATCQVEPKPRAKDKTVSPIVFKGLRISGETQLRPSTVTQGQMIREGTASVHGIVQVCIATDGRVTSATMAASTKYQEYDATLLAGVRDWRYRPYLLDGAPVPACSTVTFNYTMK
jgi:TonB family protein